MGLVCQHDNLNNLWSKKKLKWQQRRCCFSQDYHFIYCPIPKVACSSLKAIVVLCSDINEKESILKLSNFDFHFYINKNLTLSRLNYNRAITLLNNDEYFKFAFVRNPWERAASAYLNKFVVDTTPDFPALSVLQKIYQKNLSSSNISQSITFKQFINYLSNTEDENLNVHWKPQHLFLERIKIDFIGRFENMREDYKYIKKVLNIPFEVPWFNRNYITSKFYAPDLDCSNLYPHVLRKMKCLPHYKFLYNAELIELVRQRFAKDIEMFNYSYIQ